MKKRKRVDEEAESSKPTKKPRRRHVIENDEEDDEEKTKSKNIFHFRVGVHKPQKIIDEFFHNISAVLSRFHFTKYEKLDIANKNKVYEATLNMMAKFKHT